MKNITRTLFAVGLGLVMIVVNAIVASSLTPRELLFLESFILGCLVAHLVDGVTRRAA